MFSKGFTLIELMIAIAILGILYAIALPSYSRFIQDGRRADVQQFLLQQVAILEKQYTRQGGYPEVYPIVATEYYTFNYVPSTDSLVAPGSHDSMTFEISATPVVGSSQHSDPCGQLTINEQGQMLPLQTGCWGK